MAPMCIHGVPLGCTPCQLANMDTIVPESSDMPTQMVEQHEVEGPAAHNVELHEVEEPAPQLNSDVLQNIITFVDDREQLHAMLITALQNEMNLREDLRYEHANLRAVRAEVRNDFAFLHRALYSALRALHRCGELTGVVRHEDLYDMFRAISDSRLAGADFANYLGRRATNFGGSDLDMLNIVTTTVAYLPEPLEGEVNSMESEVSSTESEVNSTGSEGGGEMELL